MTDPQAPAATQTAERKPWAFIAHRDGHWHGIFSAALPKRDLQMALGEAVEGGSSIITVYDREEYERELAKLKIWGAP